MFTYMVMMEIEFVLGNVIQQLPYLQLIIFVHNAIKINFHYIQQDKINHNVFYNQIVHKVIVVIKYK